MLRVTPITVADAKAFMAGGKHRHNKPPLQCIFAVAVSDGEAVRGVATLERPKARLLCDGVTAEISRVCTDGAHNACSMLYGACRAAAKALGYRRIITYTLASEPGSSLRAAGFIRDRDLPAAATGSRPKRHRVQTDLYGEESRPAGPKVRWVWECLPGA